jgi:hypothetical protein
MVYSFARFLSPPPYVAPDKTSNQTTMETQHTDQRPSTEMTTTGGHKVVMREYITGAEHREIRAVYMRASKGGEIADIAFEADNKAIELTVHSVDGHTDNIVNRVLNLPIADCNEIVVRVTELVEGKKKSETSSPTT